MPTYLIRNLRHITRTTYTVEVATVDQVVALLTAEPPYRVEVAGEEVEMHSGASLAPDLLNRAAV